MHSCTVQILIFPSVHCVQLELHEFVFETESTVFEGWRSSLIAQGQACIAHLKTIKLCLVTHGAVRVVIISGMRVRNLHCHSSKRLILTTLT